MSGLLPCSAQHRGETGPRVPGRKGLSVEPRLPAPPRLTTGRKPVTGPAGSGLCPGRAPATPHCPPPTSLPSSPQTPGTCRLAEPRLLLPRSHRENTWTQLGRRLIPRTQAPSATQAPLWDLGMLPLCGPDCTPQLTAPGPRGGRALADGGPSAARGVISEARGQAARAPPSVSLHSRDTSRDWQGSASGHPSRPPGQEEALSPTGVS